MAVARFSAFEIGVEGPKSLKSFFDFMSSFDQAEFVGSPRAAMTCTRSGHWLHGRIVILRGETTDEVVDVETFETETRTVEDGKEIGATSYFIINDKSRAGLFTQYRGGCSVSVIRRIFYEAFRQFKATPAGVNLPDILVKGLTSKATLKAVLKQWQVIRDFEYNLGTRVNVYTKNRTLAPYTKSEKRVIKLDVALQRKGLLGEVVDHVVQMVDQIEAEDIEASDITIKGLDQNDLETSIHPDELIQTFGSVELDELRTEAQRTLTSFTESTTLQYLIGKANEHQSLFLREPR